VSYCGATATVGTDVAVTCADADGEISVRLTSVTISTAAKKSRDERFRGGRTQSVCICTVGEERRM
jgi:hypothetical protein